MDAEYPTEEQLQRIRDWPFDDLDNALVFVQSIWHWPDFGIAQDDGVLYLATGGWSGNEDIIDAMLDNVGLNYRLICSTRGGAHEFELKKETKDSPHRETRFRLAKQLREAEATLERMRAALAAIKERAYGQSDKVAMIVLMDWIRERCDKALGEE